MANKRALALLIVALLGVFTTPLDAKTLLEANAQPEANILGTNTTPLNEKLKIVQTTRIPFDASRCAHVCCTECGVLAK